MPGRDAWESCMIFGRHSSSSIHRQSVSPRNLGIQRGSVQPPGGLKQKQSKKRDFPSRALHKRNIPSGKQSSLETGFPWLVRGNKSEFSETVTKDESGSWQFVISSILIMKKEMEAIRKFPRIGYAGTEGRLLQTFNTWAMLLHSSPNSPWSLWVQSPLCHIWWYGYL